MVRKKYEEWLEPDGLIKLQGWARSGLTDEQICKNMGIASKTFYTWKKKYPQFEQSLKRGKEIIDFQVENALFKRAIGYTYNEITKERLIDTGQRKRHGGESELTEEEWEFTKKYFNNKCCYCGSTTEELTKDHVKPLKNKGKLSFDNVIPACRSCNSKKKDKEMMSWFQSTDFYDKYKMETIHNFLRFIVSLGGTLNKNGVESELMVTKIVTKEVPPDTTAIMAWLNNRKPNEWRKQNDLDIRLKEAQIAKLESEVKTAETTESKVGELFDALKGEFEKEESING